jgi:hypothetical protein
MDDGTPTTNTPQQWCEMQINPATSLTELMKKIARLRPTSVQPTSCLGKTMTMMISRSSIFNAMIDTCSTHPSSIYSVGSSSGGRRTGYASVLFGMQNFGVYLHAS